MIECLSNPSWINPQIDVLLYLQNIRIGHLEMLDKFFLSITILGEFWIPTLIAAVIYWCIDAKAGTYLFSLEGFNVLLAHFFKMLACVYRPWILNSNLHPSPLAVPYAKGYSFPSGHSAMSSSVIGGLAFLLRKHKIACILLICIVLLVGFSRLWLGVHTPQDVVGGFTIGIILIFIVNYIVEKAEKNKNIYLYIAAAIDILAIPALIYLCYFNQYRLDYVSGELLVNPVKSKYLTCVVYSFTLGLINGCYICRRFFPFNPKQSSIKNRIIKGILGVIVVSLLLKYVFKSVVMNMYAIELSMSVMCLIGLSITLFYPLIFNYIEKIHTR